MTMKRIGFLLALALALGALGALAAGAAPPPPATTGEAQDDVGAMMERLEGGWYGVDNPTPIGAMDFVLLFDRQPDGSLLARTPLNSETWVELQFRRDAAGRWLLREAAAMEGLGRQTYTLAPAGRVAAAQRWVYAADPAFLWVDVDVSDEEMTLDVVLRGEPHASFRLTRMAPQDVAPMRAQLELQGSQSPREGVSVADVVAAIRAAEATPPPDGDDAEDAAAIAAARAAVAEGPRRASAHLALARVLGAAIQRHPANGPRYAGEMLASLERAVELDPRLTAAYQALVGYYLNAPPIAGGSLAKAEETARRLAAFDAEAGAELLRRIAARGGS